MEQFMPLEMLRNNFKANIAKLQLITKDNHVTLYKAFTSFGYMTLIVESFLSTSQKGILKRLEERNSLISKQQIVTPLIFEQEIIKMRDDYIICMTLCESIVFCEGQEIVNLKAESLFQNLVKCAYNMSNSNFTYCLECYCLKTLIKSTHNSTFFFNFTKINLEQDQQSLQCFQLFKSALCALMQQCRRDKIQQINFICQYPFMFNLQKISASQNWFDLAMMFNLLLNQTITVITEARTKVLPINRLTGVNKVQYKGIVYEGLTFKDGFRTDGTRELTLDQLKGRFFEDKMVYYMTKEKYMCVRKEAIEKEEEWIVNKIEYQDLILVKPQISKVQFINFLIAYIKFIQPLLHQIHFYAQENILQLVFTSKFGKTRKIAIKFHHKYIVKDEELSMIIEKSKLKKASMSLQNMSFGDGFLIFLANCDKMLQVKSFNISHCSKITESGINLLISSPLCKNIEVLKISSLPLPDFQLMKAKVKLKELHISNCATSEQGQQVYLGQLSMERLEAIGVSLELKVSENLKYLYMSQDMSVQQLRMLKDLALLELKIKLVQNKKTITSFFNTINNLYSKDNPLKLFCEGKSKKTLKYLDVSHSTIKLKDIKPILYLQNLQTLICQNMERDKFIDIVLPHHIVTLSLQGSKITAEVLQEMTERINFFIRLNILKTDISERTVEQSIKGKKYINLLQMGEEQIEMNFISKKSCMEGLQVHLHKLLRDDKEPILNYILFKQITICKQLNFVCQAKHQSRLASKINRFLILYQDKLRKMANELTLNVNSISILKLIRLKAKAQSSEHITVVNKKAANHKIHIDSRTLLAQYYRLPILDDYLTIDLFNVTLHKVIQIYPDSLLEICIRSNRVLDKNVVSLIRKYAGNRLLAIDFRNCLFTYGQIHQELYEFPYLQSVNEGEYEISLSEEDQCEHELQKILKFFMKLRQDKIKLSLTALAIPERELYFSIISQIITHHSSNLVLLRIRFENVPLESHSVCFWRQIFVLQKLETFHLYYRNDFATSVEQQMQMAIQFEKMGNLNLLSLQIETNMHLAIPQQLAFPHLHRLSIAYNQMDISEATVSKLLRSTPTLTSLALNMQGTTIASVHKISDSIQRMPYLAVLTLNFQNSTIKEHSLLDLVQNLHKNTHLQRVDLNVNNCAIGIHELVKAFQNLINRIKFCHVSVAALQSKKPNYLVDLAQLLSLGIQLIFTA